MANSSIRLCEQDGSLIPNPPAGKFVLFLDLDGTWKKKDDSGVITPAYDVDTTSTTFSTYGSSNSANVTNSYLRAGGNAFMNISPFVLPFDCTLVAISAATELPETWIAEIHSGLSIIPGATLSLTATDTGSRNDLNIDLSLGDEIEFFVNGTTISRPSITAFFVRR